MCRERRLVIWQSIWSGCADKFVDGATVSVDTTGTVALFYVGGSCDSLISEKNRGIICSAYIGVLGIENRRR